MKAVVDLGSNTVKYAIGEMSCSVLKIADSASWPTRLGKGIKEGLLSDKSVADTKDALHKMLSVFQSKQVTASRVVATSAVRDARNAQVISEAVQEILGTPLEILSGLDEARLSFKGATAGIVHAIPDAKPILIDVGGASTEVGILWPQFQAHSFQAGALRCHEALKLDVMPVSNETWAKSQTELVNFFPAEKLAPFMGNSLCKRALVAVGGTLVLGARLAGASKIYEGIGVETNFKKLSLFADTMRKKSLSERLAIKGVPAGRADLLPCGILILLHLMKEFGQDNVFVTEWGLRHGLLLELFHK